MVGFLYIKLSVLHWRVGAIKQMRRLARGNPGKLAMGQPPKLLLSKHIHWPRVLVVQVTRGISHGTITSPKVISKQQRGQPSNGLILICHPFKRNELGNPCKSHLQCNSNSLCNQCQCNPFSICRKAIS